MIELKKLLIYIKEYKKECILGPLFKLLEAVFDLIVPIVMAYMIDTGIAQKNTNVIIRMGVLLIVLAAIGLTCSITAQYFAAKAATGFVKNIRLELFSHIQRLSVSDIEKTGSSTLITRMTSDINQLQAGTNMALRLFLRSPFIIVGAVIMSFSIDTREAFVFVVLVPILALVVFAVMLVTKPMYKKVQQHLDRLMLHMEENISGIRIIRAFNKENRQINEFSEDNQTLISSQLKVGKIASLMNPVTYLILNGALLVLIWTGAIRMNIGVLMAGQLIALINYMTQILTEMIKLADTIILCTKAVSCGDRIQAIFEIKPQNDIENNETIIQNIDPIKTKQDKSKSDKTKPDKSKSDKTQSNITISNKTQPILVFEHVYYTYPDSQETSLEDISFSAYEGSMIGIIGSTGSGKTTLINLISRLLETEDGNIIYNGKNINEYSLKELRAKISIVQQKNVLFSGSIQDNLKISNPDADKEDIDEALKISESYDFVYDKEDNINYKLNENASNLSGGQRQRISIARALVRKPKLLVFDDSFSALDYATDAKLRNNIKMLDYKPAVIIVSQRVSSIRNCDNIIVLDDGKISDCGKHDELIKQSDLYRQIYESQEKLS